ncbi:HD domain-containing protein [Streptomyces bohaiensis]|uniref:HD domain-containing protein n=1 Tax=Streptomyces bohaiensis TaxID=1431344 RepID=UPI001FD791B4|nr:hypothetical protein [Streptomyces bohaiensis]
MKPLLPDPVEAAALAAELLARWAEPHRVYHAVPHLAAVLDRLDELADHPADPAAVALAAWFHDAVYDPAAGDNEERSAVLAETLLPAAGCPAGRTAAVARLVRLTATHAPEPGDRDGEALCDADLAVLAGPPQEYAHYAAAVRREYASVPEPAFREGRAAVLRRLLALPALYRTPYGSRHWEATARFNLRAELELLTV